MKKETFLICIFFFVLSCVFFFQKVQAQSTDTDESTNPKTSTETFIDSITIDLPEATLTCRTSGSISQIFRKSTKFRSGGNAFFVDRANKEIALFEKAVVQDTTNSKDITVDVFIKVPNVSRDNLVSLLLNKSLVISKNSQIIFLVRESKEDTEDIYLFDGKDENGNLLASTLFTQVKKLSTITFNDEKFFAADGTIKIRMPKPPKKLTSDGNLVDVFADSPAILVCFCKGCPIHDFDLSDLDEAFDSGLVNDITNEATANE